MDDRSGSKVKDNRKKSVEGAFFKIGHLAQGLSVF
jgi:hypothetical protein